MCVCAFFVQIMRPSCGRSCMGSCRLPFRHTGRDELASMCSIILACRSVLVIWHSIACQIKCTARAFRNFLAPFNHRQSTRVCKGWVSRQCVLFVTQREPGRCCSASERSHPRVISGPVMCVHAVSHSVRCACEISGAVVVDPRACFDLELRTTIAHVFWLCEWALPEGRDSIVWLVCQLNSLAFHSL